MSDLHNLHSLVPQSNFEIVTDTASVVAIATPWWLPWLRETSEVAAYVLPIMGVLWLSTQIGFKFYNQFRQK